MLLSLILLSRRLRGIAAWPLLAASLALAGCASPSEAPAGGSADASADASDEPWEAGTDQDAPTNPDVGFEASKPDVGVTAVGCTEAVDIRSMGEASGEIDPASGEPDYYKFRAFSGEFFRFDAVMTSGVDPWLAVTLLSLYRGDGTTLVASSFAGDFPVKQESEATLAYRSVDDETYCLKVDGRRSWFAQDGTLSTVGYELQARSYSALTGQYDRDTEPNDGLAAAQPLLNLTDVAKYQGLIKSYEVVGMLDTETDVDVYRVSIPSGMGTVWIYHAPAGPGGDGVQGSGATGGVGQVEVTDTAGQVIAKMDASHTASWIGLTPSPGQPVMLRVSRDPSRPVGPNDFYRIRIWTAPWGADYAESETQPGTNDTLATAEPTVGGKLSSGLFYWFVGALQPTVSGDPMDVDTHAFGAPAGSQLALSCWAKRMGAGLTQATFAVLDADGGVLRSTVEAEDEDLEWGYRPGSAAPPLTLPPGGKFYLRVTAAGQVADVVSKRYECIAWELFP